MSVAIAVKRRDVLCEDTWEKWPVACDSAGDTQRAGNGAMKAALAHYARTRRGKQGDETERKESNLPG